MNWQIETTYFINQYDGESPNLAVLAISPKLAARKYVNWLMRNKLRVPDCFRVQDLNGKTVKDWSFHAEKNGKHGTYKITMKGVDW